MVRYGMLVLSVDVVWLETVKYEDHKQPGRLWKASHISVPPSISRRRIWR